MAFLGGAECSTAGNPLSQFAKHVQDDKSLQHDRLVGRSPNASLNGFRSAPMNAPQDEMVNGFLRQAPGLPEMPLEQAHFQQQLRLDPHGQGVNMRAHSASPPWAEDFAGPAAMAPSPFSADEFARFAGSARSSPMPAISSSAASHHSPQRQQPQQQPPSLMNGNMGMGMMGAGVGYGGAMGLMSRPMYQPPMMGPAMYGPSQMAPMPQAEVEGKGKGKVVELDDSTWEAQFAQMELHDQTLRYAHETHDQENKQAKDDDAAARAMEPELNQMDEALLADHSETNYGDLESIWRGIQDEQAAMRGLDGEDKFGDFDFSTDLDRKLAGDLSDDWGTTNARLGMDPPVETYLFEPENLFANKPNPFEEGMRIMSEGGNLSLAALAFEAAAQRSPEHVDAWVWLGTAQAQNEKEDPAIRALEQALKLDPNNLAALMGLAVSYTNEGYDSTAYRTLERWLSVKYPQIIAPADLSSAAEMGFTDRQQLHKRVTDLYLAAAQLAPDMAHMDPDVQVGLGVLCYGAEEYDKAVDCFRAALASSEMGTSNQHSQVHLLWNRLGATLANSGHSEDAIAAYEKALTLHPNFVRARYNLGVSCINIGCPEQAAGHLLAALDMHQAVEKSGRDKARELLGAGGSSSASVDRQIDSMTAQNRSTTLYDTLRRVFVQMGRKDLAERVVAGMDPEVFRGEVDF